MSATRGRRRGQSTYAPGESPVEECSDESGSSAEEDHGEGDFDINYLGELDDEMQEQIRQLFKLERNIGQNNTDIIESKHGRSRDGKDTVMLSSCQYYLHENNGSTTVTVIRLGDASTEIKVRYHCKGAPKRVYKTEGELVFVPGLHEQNVEIKVSDNDVWEPQETFLFVVEKDANFHLGQHQAHVTLLDEDKFPANMNANHRNHEWQLMKAFIRERWLARGPKALKTALAWLYISFYKNFVAVIVHNRVIKWTKDLADDDCNEDPDCNVDDTVRLIIILLVTCNVVLFGFSHKADIVQQDLRGRSGTRKDLRNWMTLKFLEFDHESHEDWNELEWLNTSMFQVEESVNNGWFQSFMLLYNSSGIVFNLLVIFTINILDDKGGIGGVFFALVPIVFIAPVGAFFSIVQRGAMNKKLAVNRQKTEDSWVSVLSDILLNWDLISTYRTNEGNAKTFKTNYEVFYNTHRKHRFFEQTSKWVMVWVLNLMNITIYILGPIMYSDDIATYMTLIKVYSKVQKLCIAINKSLLKMLRASVALGKVADCLNAKTGADERSQNLSRVLERARKLRHEGIKMEMDGQKSPEGALIVSNAFLGHRSGKELSLIELHDVSFVAVDTAGTQRVIFQNLSACIPTGKCYIMQGKLPSGHGKITMSRILGGVSRPTNGLVYVPPQLFTICVAPEPEFIQRSLWENLTFGNQGASGPDWESYVWDLAINLGLSEFYRNKKDFQVGRGGRSLRAADQMAVHLTRALLAEPDILILNRPVSLFSSAQRQRSLMTLIMWSKAATKVRWKPTWSGVERTLIMNLPNEVGIPHGIDAVLDIGKYDLKVREVLPQQRRSKRHMHNAPANTETASSLVAFEARDDDTEQQTRAKLENLSRIQGALVAKLARFEQASLDQGTVNVTATVQSPAPQLANRPTYESGNSTIPNGDFMSDWWF